MLELMIEMADLLERMADGQQVAPEEARSIKDRLQTIREDFLRDRQVAKEDDGGRHDGETAATYR